MEQVNTFARTGRGVNRKRGGHMFICLSSAASPRYRQDVLRAIAMPRGSQLQFRYDSKWIDPKVQSQLSRMEVSGEPSLISYIDQHDKTKIPELIPLRFAKLVTATSHGTTASIIFELEDFAYAEDIVEFNSEMKSVSKDALPTWQPDGTIRGAYWLKIHQELKKVTRSATLDTWEKIVGQIAERTDFLDESCFYFVKGFYPLGNANEISLMDNRYELASAREHEIQIYHFHPKNVPQGTRLHLSTSSQWLTFTTNPLLILDSRYDLKRVRLKTGEPSKAEDTILTILRTDDASGSESGNWEFDLRLRIKGIFLRTLGYGVFLGVLLATPPITAAFSNPNLPLVNASIISVLSLITSLIAGVFVAFGLRKSI